MADKKISQLTGATTPLAGTEVLPIVQGGSTVKVSAENITAGRPVSAGSLSLTNGGVTASVASGNIGFGATTGTTNYSLYINDADGSYRLYSSFGSDRFVIDNAGNFEINVGNLKLGTAGKGIDFSANGGDVLKQYDEGTWVPTITAGSGSITSYTSAGKFTRIGRQVTLTCSITVTDNGTGSGYIMVGNLPFSADASVYAAYGHNNTVGGSVSGATAGALIYLNKYDGSYPVATGQTLLLTSIYFV